MKQYLVVGGRDVKGYNSTATEVLDFSNSNLTKPSFGEIPETRDVAVGAYLNDQPILCGGDDGDFRNPAYDTCLTFRNSRWSQTHKLTTGRRAAVSVQLNETTLWILGGGGGGGRNLLNSTEFINVNNQNGIPGKELPAAMWRGCAVKYSSEKIFVIGGVGTIGYYKGNPEIGYLNKVWIFNPKDNFSYVTGPSLKLPRGRHGCALMKNGDKSLIVIAGGYSCIWGDYLTQVDILDPSNDNNQWTPGPSLPSFRQDIANAMFTSPDGGGVMIAGGIDVPNNGVISNIFELRAGAKNWTQLEQKLNQPRSDHVIIPLK